MQPIYIVKKRTCMHFFQLTSAFWQVINLFSHKETASIVLCIPRCKSPWGGTLTKTYRSWIQCEHTYSLIVWGNEYRISDFYKSYKVNRLHKAMFLEIATSWLLLLSRNTKSDFGLWYGNENNSATLKKLLGRKNNIIYPKNSTAYLLNWYK